MLHLSKAVSRQSAFLKTGRNVLNNSYDGQHIYCLFGLDLLIGTTNLISARSVNAMAEFCLNDYDAIGLDLDHTLARYHLAPMSQLTFRILTRFLIEKKSFPSQIEEQTSRVTYADFFVKGLVLDKARGNFLRLSSDHTILKATHGTSTLTSKEIETIYGPKSVWDATEGLVDTLCQPQSLQHPFFLFRDYFVVPVPFLVARGVDLVDLNPDASWCRPYIRIWEDVLEGVVDMYRRDAFRMNEGAYFPAIRKDPSVYLVPCDKDLLNWLQELQRKDKKVFLLTSSHIDYAEELMRHCAGRDWKSYFDLIITYARKPAFFTAGRPFLELDGERETDTIVTSISKGGNYSQGNWQELRSFFIRECGKEQPRILYVGDSLVDDVACPSTFAEGCDTVAVLEEMASEGMLGHPPHHPAAAELNSRFWGSFFVYESTKCETLLGKVVRTHAKVAVPHLSVLARISLHQKVPAFSANNAFSGYYPGIPLACNEYLSIS